MAGALPRSRCPALEERHLREIKLIHCNDVPEFGAAMGEAFDEIKHLSAEYGYSLEEYREIADRLPEVDIVVTDLNFEHAPGGERDGLTIMEDALERWPSCHVILYSQQGERLLRVGSVLDLLHRHRDRLDIYDIGGTFGESQVEVVAAHVRSICRLIRQEWRASAATMREPLSFLSRGAAHMLAGQVGGIQLALERQALKAGDADLSPILEQLEGLTRSVHLLQEIGERGESGVKSADVSVMLGILEGVTARRLKEKYAIDTRFEAEEGQLSAAIPFFDLMMCLLHLLQNAEESIRQANRFESTRGGSIRLGARAVRDRLLIDIEDNGEGMTAEVLARAREPFFTTKGMREHGGLGLSETESRLKRYGGRLKLSSTPGAGATATLDVPALKSDV